MVVTVKFESKTFAGIAMAVVSVLCFVPVLLWGPPADSADMTHHVQITHAYVTGFQSGTLTPNWTDAENTGYGSIAVRFYPPLIHMTIALFKLVVVRMDWAMFAAFSLWSLIGCWGMYLWTRDIVGGWLAPLTGALLFGISPYHLNQFYNSFMLGEFVSLSTLPFAFFFTRRLCADGGVKNVVGLAGATAALVLSNIPQMLVCFPFIALYALLCLDRENLLRQISLLAASAGLAVLCTAFYWYRVIAEMSWIHIAEPNLEPNYDFRNNFLFSGTGAGAEGLGFGSIILLLSVLLAAGVLLASGRYRSILGDREIAAPIVMLTLSVFMVLPLSQPVWEAIAPLQRVQFPWRFLSVTSLAASIIMAYGVAAVDRSSIQRNRPAVLAIIGCVLILATFSVKQVILGAAFAEPGAFNKMAEASVNANGLYHWWPIWASKNTFRERTDVVAGDRQVETLQWNSDAREFTIAPGEPATVRTAVLYYPWWRATVNGIQVETQSVGGALGFDIGAESAACVVTFREPDYTAMSRGVSVVTILGVLLFFATLTFRRKASYG
ncbi:MAG TPA: hypothetical protein VNA22_09910 [Pyrinomonadaceae bacterium]|nr:hypothetical protein [Pyrinomonadaceae bacterium]